MARSARSARGGSPRSTGAPVVIQAGDRLDVEAADGLLEQLRSAVETAAGALTVDLGGAESAHGAALQVLVAAARGCAERGRPFHLTGVSPRLAETLRLAGLAGLLGLAEPPGEPRGEPRGEPLGAAGQDAGIGA